MSSKERNRPGQEFWVKLSGKKDTWVELLLRKPDGRMDASEPKTYIAGYLVNSSEKGLTIRIPDEDSDQIIRRENIKWVR